MLKEFKTGDHIIIWLSLIIVLFLSFFFPFINNEQGHTALIYIDGELTYKLDLETDQELDIDTKFGHNLIVVENGMIGVVESDCHDHICEKTGFINAAGSTIVCLPNRIIIEIESSEAPLVDDVSM